MHIAMVSYTFKQETKNEHQPAMPGCTTRQGTSVFLYRAGGIRFFMNGQITSSGLYRATAWIISAPVVTSTDVGLA